MGLLFIGFIMLVLGLFGIDSYRMLNGVFDPMVADSVFAVALFGGLALAVVAIFAFKAKSNLGASLFGWASLTFLLFAAYNNTFETE